MTTSEIMGTAKDDATAARRPSLTLVDIFTPVEKEIKLVEDHLKTNLIDDSPFVGDLLAQIFQAGGKRIRPSMTLLAAAATAEDAKPNRLHIILAVLTEFIHTASLVHDDVIDQATLRRGQETLNYRFNERLAVLTGDLLFAQASICLSRLMNPTIVGIYGKVLGDLCAGEIGQMGQKFSTAIDWNGYINKSVNKTASLFAAGSQSAAILSAANDDVIMALETFGLNLGIGFQIVDDLLDVCRSADELGKPVGSDLANGIITAPAIFVLEQNDAPARKLAHLIKSRAVQSKEGNAEAREIIAAAGGLLKTGQLSRRYAELSKKSLLSVPRSCYRDSLEMLIDYVAVRTS